MFGMRSAGWLVLMLAASVQGARKPEFNVDFFCGWDGYYRAMEWTPVEIQVGSDLKEPFSGSLTVSARQDGLNTLNIVHTFVLTPDLPLTMPLVTKFAFAADKCDLTIRDERRRIWWQNSINMWELSTQSRMLRVVQEQDLLIGLAGQGRFGLLRLPREAVCTSERGPGKVCLGNKVPRAMPWDWTGFASLDILILYDPDWTLLRRQQLNAIREWVSNGGAMLLILGQHPLSQDSPVADLIPFHIGEPRQTVVPGIALVEWGLDSSRPQSVTAWPLFPKSQALLTKKIEAPEAGYLYGTGHAGFGRVAVLAFNPSQLGEEQARYTAEFWMRHIAACLGDTPDSSGATISIPTRDLSRAGSPPWNLQGLQCMTGRGYNIALARNTAPEGENAPGGYRPNNRFRISMAQSASNRVMEYLYQLRQMRPLSIWWVILTLSALAVLLGPVDYLVLKRFDKLPYTWLTSTGWILIFTVGAYYGVQWLRGGDMELRTVSVLDGIADSNCAWATCYSSLFAPRSDDYHLENLRPNQWWSGVSPSQEELYAYQREASLRQIHCLQVDGSNLPVSLPISIWTIQSLLSEWPIGEMPFAATVSRPDTAAGELMVEIRNTSDSAIRAGFVLLADACADLGAVPARSTQRFELRARPFQLWSRAVRGGRPPGTWPGADTPRYPGYLGGVADQAFFAQGCLSRTLAMHASLHSGRALVCVVYVDAPMPFGVEDYSYKTNHVQLARQIVPIGEGEIRNSNVEIRNKSESQKSQ